MSNILPLFTTLEDIDFKLVDESDGCYLKEGSHFLKDGTEIKIMIATDEEDTTYIITGGFKFLSFDTEAELVRAFFDIQKGKIDIHE